MHSDDIAKIAFAAAIGACVGAIAMFLFDPESGRRRRALARDKLVHYGHEVVDSVESTTRDLRNRAQGAMAEARTAASNVMDWSGAERRRGPRGGINQTPGTGAE